MSVTVLRPKCKFIRLVAVFIGNASELIIEFNSVLDDLFERSLICWFKLIVGLETESDNFKRLAKGFITFVFSTTS